MEVLVVDNGSTDGTAGAVERHELDPRVIRRHRNEGVSARNHAFAVAQGEYLLLIDDDSYPIDGAAVQSMRYLDAHSRCAAVVGRIELPDGGLEASALPGVVANGAVVLRKAVIDEVGGFPTEFFRQAEEYDLSFRIWNAGWTIERFEDLVYRHEKVAGNRTAPLIHRMDMRNNLILVDRYLPQPWRAGYRTDWLQRYMALARHAGSLSAAWRGRAGSWAWRLRAALGERQVLQAPAFEAIFEPAKQARRVATWAGEHSIRRVAIADFGKNIRATHRACTHCGLDVLAVADHHPAFAGLIWNNLPIQSDERVRSMHPDGVVLSNVNPAQVGRRVTELERVFSCPVLSLWQPRYLEAGITGHPANYHDAA